MHPPSDPPAGELNPLPASPSKIDRDLQALLDLAKDLNKVQHQCLSSEVAEDRNAINPLLNSHLMQAFNPGSGMSRKVRILKPRSSALGFWRAKKGKKCREMNAFMVGSLWIATFRLVLARH